ncbi:hypothetical protein M2140_000139 [Clostridiales Family XIII bacterium PM5-7]
MTGFPVFFYEASFSKTPRDSTRKEEKLKIGR